jgi:hypothetical protein
MKPFTVYVRGIKTVKAITIRAKYYHLVGSGESTAFEFVGDSGEDIHATFPHREVICILDPAWSGDKETKSVTE